jgi:putative ABC transport system permease protein
MSWSWVDSLENMLNKGFNEIAQWDIQVAFNEAQNDTTRSDIVSWDDVLEAEPVVLVPATIKPVEPNVDAEKKQVDITLTTFRPKQKMVMLDLIKNKYSNWTVEDALAKDRLILTPIAAEKLMLLVGDKVTVTNVFGTHRLELSAIADQINDAQGYIGTETISGTQYAGLFNMLYLTTDPDQADHIKKALYTLPNGASVQSKAEARATYNLLLGLFYAFVGIMLIFSLAMAFALLYNGITITITERQREFATMRSIGTSEGRIARQLIVENVIVWLIAILPGWILGTVVAVAIGSTLSTEWMHFQVTLDPKTYVWSSLIILATMILAGIPAFKRLQKVDLATGTKGAV